MKKCKKCGIDKNLCDFRYRQDRKIYYSQCKECEKLYKKNRHLKNIEENKNSRKDYYERNKEKIISKVIQYQKENNTWMKKYKSDPIFRMNHNVRGRIREFLNSKKISKKNKTSIIVGCNQQELKEFLEQKFYSDMSWDNYGKWHIDHIIPLSSAQNEDEILKLCHFSNLQPLWAEDNWKKNSKIL
jgi:hypothetical protein